MQHVDIFDRTIHAIDGFSRSSETIAIATTLLSLFTFQMSIPPPHRGRHGAPLPPPLLQNVHVRPRYGREGALHEERGALRVRSRRPRLAPPRARRQGTSGDGESRRGGWRLGRPQRLR